ncbi:MAG: FkbM family methyltransferase [Actinomycetota bacterium]
MIRSNLWVYDQVRRRAVFLCRFFLLEEGFSFLRHIQAQHGTVALDIGSNDGTSIEMIRRLQPGVPIHAFDPVIKPKVAHRYREVTFHNVALSQSEEELTLYIPTVHRLQLTQYSSNDPKKVVSQLLGDFPIEKSEISFTKVTSKSIRLDTAELKPYFIKIDVEGQEESVLRGSLEIISRNRPVLLIELQSFEAYQSVEKLMIELDYFNLLWPQKKHTVDLTVAGTYSKKMNNYLWLPRKNSQSWAPKIVR